MSESTKQTEVVRVVEVPSTPTHQQPTELVWYLVGKVADGSTAVLFAGAILWFVFRKHIGDGITRFYGLIDTLSKSTRENADSQKQLTVVLDQMRQDDNNVATRLSRMEVLLKQIRSYQTGIPQNRPPFVIEPEDIDPTTR